MFPLGASGPRNSPIGYFNCVREQRILCPCLAGLTKSVSRLYPGFHITTQVSFLWWHIYASATAFACLTKSAKFHDALLPWVSSLSTIPHPSASGSYYTDNGNNSGFVKKIHLGGWVEQVSDPVERNHMVQPTSMHGLLSNYTSSLHKRPRSGHPMIAWLLHINSYFAS